MRQIVLDTETTGLSWERGNRLIEIGCVELLERRPTGRRFQRYLNPERDLESGAQEVTGLTREFLADKPKFEQIVEEFLEFVRGAELIIHNASFDVGFLDYELSLAGAQFGKIHDHASVLDTLALARERYPGQRNSLDALCKRLGVENGHRQLHGALLDADLLAEVYLALTAGQGELGLSLASSDGAREACSVAVVAIASTKRRLQRATDEEEAEHSARLQKIAKKAGGTALWSALETMAAENAAVPIYA